MNDLRLHRIPCLVIADQYPLIGGESHTHVCGAGQEGWKGYWLWRREDLREGAQGAESAHR